MKAVIYARYSSDSQREESIEGQLRECAAFAEKKRYHGIAALHRPCVFCKDRQPPGVPEHDKGQRQAAV